MTSDVMSIFEFYCLTFFRRMSPSTLSTCKMQKTF